MRYFLYLSTICIALIILAIFYKLLKGDKYYTSGIAILLCIVMAMVFKVINVNTVNIENISKEAVVRVNSEDTIEILIQGEWVDTSDIALVSWINEGVVIDCNGKEVKVIDSGVVSTIKVLEKLGVLGK